MRGVHSTREGVYVRVLEKDGTFDRVKTAKTLVKFLKESFPEDYMEIAESLGASLIPFDGEKGQKYYDWTELEE